MYNTLDYFTYFDVSLESVMAQPFQSRNYLPLYQIYQFLKFDNETNISFFEAFQIAFLKVWIVTIKWDTVTILADNLHNPSQLILELDDIKPLCVIYTRNKSYYSNSHGLFFNILLITILKYFATKHSKF